jgi:glycosyltransferase involved in cell wall biosynthesis
MLKVLYVYHGTGGLSGAYIHGITQAIQKAQGNIECYIAVNFYYKFIESHAELICPFFPLTEMDEDNRFFSFWRIPMSRFLRLPLRYFELICGYIFVLFYIFYRHIDVVNLSVIDDEIPTWLFVKSVKILGRKLFVTAHDTLPYGSRASIGRRRDIFNMADRIVVHYEHVKLDLLEYFDVLPDKVLLHTYPGCDVTSIIDQNRYSKYIQDMRNDLEQYERIFLFVGVMRPQKGVHLLAEAWQKVSASQLNNSCFLLVAGRSVKSLNVRSLFENMSNVRLIDRYLDNEEFWAFLNFADVVIFPYSADFYAHSAAVLMSFLASKCVIASDIPLFERLINEKIGYLFKSNDIEALTRLIVRVYREEKQTLQNKGEAGRKMLLNEWERVLPSEIARIYDI